MGIYYLINILKQKILSSKKLGKENVDTLKHLYCCMFFWDPLFSIGGMCSSLVKQVIKSGRCLWWYLFKIIKACHINC